MLSVFSIEVVVIATYCDLASIKPLLCDSLIALK